MPTALPARLARRPWPLACAFAAFLLAACGGGGGSSGGGAVLPSPITPLVLAGGNQVPLVVGPGPLDEAGRSFSVANIPYVSVTICRPGSASVCQTISQVQVDTGSSGLRIVASALNPQLGLQPVLAPNGSAAAVCAQFADGHSWGAVRQADIYLGSERAAAQSVHIVGDAAFPLTPASCASGLPPRNSVSAYSANGILGVGSFRQDCGNACALFAIAGNYYTCNATSCQPSTMPLARQLANPVTAFAVNNNGSLITLPAVPSASAASVTGTLTFGIATQANNALGAARIHTLDSERFLTTRYNGSDRSGFFDSGSNGIFFADNTIASCTRAVGFFCPPTTLNLNAVNTGRNLVASSVNFSISNIETLFDANPSFTVYPGLGGNLAGLFGVSDVFDWGLPFFYNRSVFTSLEDALVNGQSGPFVAY